MSYEKDGEIFNPMERAVNQVLWHDTIGKFNLYEFENDTFLLRPYDWEDEWDNSWHFWHKPSNLKVSWYKYPLRSPYCNMDITHEQFLDVLRDCTNSLDRKFANGIKVTHSINEWWRSEI